MCPRFSITLTAKPAVANALATVAPAKPAPTTKIDFSLIIDTPDIRNFRAEKLNHKFIIGHVRPAIQFPKEFGFLTAHPEISTDIVIETEEVTQAGLSDRRIGEYHFLFALMKRLESIHAKGKVTIVQYRRFVTSTPIGFPAQNMSYARVITTNSSKALPFENLLQPIEGDWLVSTPTKVSPCVASQFAKHHELRDWWRFLSDAIDAGCITNEDSRLASLSGTLIPAPSNGVFPIQKFLSQIKTLETAALAFIHGGFIERAEYQRRSLGFCLERLHSYLVLRDLANSGLDLGKVSGYQTVVSDTALVTKTV